MLVVQEKIAGYLAEQKAQTERNNEQIRKEMAGWRTVSRFGFILYKLLEKENDKGREPFRSSHVTVDYDNVRIYIGSNNNLIFLNRSILLELDRNGMVVSNPHCYDPHYFVTVLKELFSKAA